MSDEEQKFKKRLSKLQKRALRAAELALFERRYGRKAQKGVEPNDRKFDRETERRVKQMSPVEFDRLIRDDEE